MNTTGPGQSPLLLPDVVRCLESAALPHAVIGAMALAFYGVIRASQNVDLLLLPPPAEIKPLLDSLRALGLEVEHRAGDIDDPIAGLIRLRDVHGNQIDLLTELRGMDAAAPSRTVQTEHEGVRLRFVGLEDLIAMKLFAGSAQDLEDARRLIAGAGASLDADLVRRIASGFGRRERTLLDDLLSARP